MRVVFPKNSDKKAACTLEYKSAGCFFKFQVAFGLYNFIEVVRSGCLTFTTV